MLELHLLHVKNLALVQYMLPQSPTMSWLNQFYVRVQMGCWNCQQKEKVVMDHKRQIDGCSVSQLYTCLT